MEYSLSVISENNIREQKQMISLLEKEGIQKDGNLDFSLGLFDEDYNLVATGSCFKNTLRCMAVDSSHQGEGLLNQIVTALIDHQYSIGNKDLYLYTKINSVKFFNDLGFYEIARVDDKLVFMENKKDGFQNYLESFAQYKKPGLSAAIVMNANPFTKGHRYLVEKAIEGCDNLYIFVVSEDASEISFENRFDLVKKGTADLDKVNVIPSGDYIISHATFPSYFLKETGLVATTHASLDITVFAKIAATLGISKRYIGTEPYSETTKIYNDVMKRDLPLHGIEVIEIKRLSDNGNIISASKVREALRANDTEILKSFLPETTYTNLVMKERL